MIPKLYKDGRWDVTSSGETVFNKTFVGVLSDAISCKVTRALDSEYTYTLEMKYPVTGANFSDIACRTLILAKPDIERDPQLFEVYRISIPINGVITVYANHISYMLASIPVPAFLVPRGVSTSLIVIKNTSRTLIPHDFVLSVDPDSDVASSAAQMDLDIPRSVRAALVGSEGSYVDTFGGELDFDGFNITVRDKLGKESVAKIRYGVNMISFEQDENMTTVYTGIYPYATTYIADENGEYVLNVVTVDDGIIYASEDSPYKKVKVVDLTAKFMDSNGTTADITPENLLEAAKEYISENQWGIPSVNIKVSFVPLSQTEEYREFIGIEDIALGDTLKVEYPAVGITATARCVKTVFDSISEKYKEIEVGKVKKNIINTLAQMRRDINKLRRR